MERMGCALDRLDKERTIELLQKTLGGLNEFGLRCVVQSILAAMYRSAETNLPIEAVLQEACIDPIAQEVLHLHRHIVGHLLSAKHGHAMAHVHVPN